MPKYFVNKETFIESTKIIEKRMNLFYDVIEETPKNFELFKVCKVNFDDRDLLNMSYILSRNNPNLTDEEFKNEVKKMLDAFSPKFNKEELKKYKEDLLKINEEEYKNNLDNISLAKEKAAEYEKVAYHSLTRLNDLKKKADPNFIKERYQNILNILNKEDFNESDLLKISNDYNLAKKYIDQIKETKYKSVCLSAKNYLDDLTNLQIEVSENIDKYDTNKLEDCYTLVSAGFMCQTFSTKYEEFETYYEAKINSIEEADKAEKYYATSMDVEKNIGIDFIELGYDSQKFSKLTLGNLGIALAGEKNKVLKWQNEAAYKIARTKVDGKIELDLHESNYSILKQVKKALKNVNNKKNISKIRSCIKDTIGEELDNLFPLGSRDLKLSRKLDTKLFDNIFIDGVPLSNIEPLKSMDKNNRNYNLIANAMFLKYSLEGNKYLATTKFNNYANKLDVKIVPIHINHNKDGYLKSRNFLYRLFFSKMDVQKHFDNKMKYNKEQISKFNQDIKLNTNKYVEKYSEIYTKESSKNPVFESKLLDSLKEKRTESNEKEVNIKKEVKQEKKI